MRINHQNHGQKQKTQDKISVNLITIDSLIFWPSLNQLLTMYKLKVQIDHWKQLNVSQDKEESKFGLFSFSDQPITRRPTKE
uniref:Uncharacterized protein n=1 Tax=Tetranychus urticae TaxID=32264 RepID=T1KPN7_TETUR